MSDLDPIIVNLFEWTRKYSREEILTNPDLMAKASFADDPDYRPPAVMVRDATIDGPLGASTLPIRLYSLDGDFTKAKSVFVWAHGGSWVAGDLDIAEADQVARELCVRGNITVVSVGYHVADGTIAYPTLHQELMAAFTWSQTMAPTLAEAGAPVLLGGASAGANLSAAAALNLRDNAAPTPDGLILVYPLLHDPNPRSTELTDMSAVPEVLRLPQEVLDPMLAFYRGPNVDGGRYLTIDGHDLHDLPPTLVVAAEYDDLRGSADKFAADARAAGVPVTEFLAAGTAHGFLNHSPAVNGNTDTLDSMAAFCSQVG